MINREELRIGNWVNGSHNGFSKDVVIYDFDRNSIQHTDETNNALPLSSFMPIELTEEWLIEFGWIKYDKFLSKTWAESGLEVIVFSTYYEKYRYQLAKGRSKVLYSVHQLQNLYFALTNKELTIK